MAQNEVIGHTACPLCKFPHQEIRLSSNKKPYIVCDDCGAQLFSRQARSVKIMQDMAAGSPAAAKPAQVAKPAPVAPVVAAKPAQVAKPAPEVKPAPAAQPAQEKEKTIFDIFG